MLTVVLGPPGEVTAANDIVEDKPDDRPGHVVERGRGRDETGAAEDDGEVDVFDERVGPFEVHEPSDDRADSADEEEEEEWAVSGMRDVRIRKRKNMDIRKDERRTSKLDPWRIDVEGQ